MRDLTGRAAKKNAQRVTSEGVGYLALITVHFLFVRTTPSDNYVFGQNMIENNPAPSPSGHPLLSGAPTTNDIHQIFTYLMYASLRQV